MTTEKFVPFCATSFDANVWAKEFMRLYKKSGYEIDFETMRGWFANAIMAGHDHAVNARHQELVPISNIEIQKVLHEEFQKELPRQDRYQFVEGEFERHANAIYKHFGQPKREELDEEKVANCIIEASKGIDKFHNTERTYDLFLSRNEISTLSKAICARFRSPKPEGVNERLMEALKKIAKGEYNNAHDNKACARIAREALAEAKGKEKEKI